MKTIKYIIYAVIVLAFILLSLWGLWNYNRIKVEHSFRLGETKKCYVISMHDLTLDVTVVGQYNIDYMKGSSTLGNIYILKKFNGRMATQGWFKGINGYESLIDYKEIINYSRYGYNIQLIAKEDEEMKYVIYVECVKYGLY